MAEKYIIELKHLTKTYEDNGFTAVDDFNLQVKHGEFVTFLGPSGCIPDALRAAALTSAVSTDSWFLI